MTAPKLCVFDRTVGYRATIGEHDDDCTDLTGHRGCIPCTHGHCSICGRTHTTDQHPLTCPECVGSVREDLFEIQELCRHLRRQAANASNDGRPWAAAAIPGADAMVMMGPSIDPQAVKMNREHSRIHRKGDLIPPLGVLAHWEDTWAGWFNQDRDGRTSVTRAAGYLDMHLTAIAQQRMTMRAGVIAIPPEFPEFARALAQLRVQLEQILHDEAAHERGVDCFECGAQLQRRIRDPKSCRHRTPAREALATRLRERPDALAHIQVLMLAGKRPTDAEVNAARLPSPADVAAARVCCDRCDQGGIEDPRPGISWECPACRKQYTPGEYATAVRRDLLDRNDGDGWTDINLAAAAATTLTHQPVLAVTVRKWMDRGKVSGCCVWGFDHLVPCQDPDWHTGCRIASRTNGQRLVFWPDVAEEAAAAVERAKVAVQDRIRKAVREQAELAIAQLRPRLGKKRRRELLASPPVRGEDLDFDAFRVLVMAKKTGTKATELLAEVAETVKAS